MLNAPHMTGKRPGSPVKEHSIRLRPAAWHSLREATGTQSDQRLAKVLGINRSNVYRVMTGEADPSPKFIAHTLNAFRFASFDRLFEPYEKTASA